MKFDRQYTSREDRYSLGQELESGRHYISIPVSNQLVDYQEFYELTDQQYAFFLEEKSQAVSFADACRRRENDALLLMQPGSDRGTAR